MYEEAKEQIFNCRTRPAQQSGKRLDSKNSSKCSKQEDFKPTKSIKDRKSKIIAAAKLLNKRVTALGFNKKKFNGQRKKSHQAKGTRFL